MNRAREFTDFNLFVNVVARLYAGGVTVACVVTNDVDEEIKLYGCNKSLTCMARYALMVLRRPKPKKEGEEKEEFVAVVDTNTLAIKARGLLNLTKEAAGPVLYVCTDTSVTLKRGATDVTVALLNEDNASPDQSLCVDDMHEVALENYGHFYECMKYWPNDCDRVRVTYRRDRNQLCVTGKDFASPVADNVVTGAIATDEETIVETVSVDLNPHTVCKNVFNAFGPKDGIVVRLKMKKDAPLIINYYKKATIDAWVAIAQSVDL